MKTRFEPRLKRMPSWKKHLGFELRSPCITSKYLATGPSNLIHNVPTKLSMSRSQLREQICSASKSDRQEWQSLIVLNATNNFLNGSNISFLKFICGILNWDVANSFWNHVIQISSRQMYFQDIDSNLWKVKVFSGNIYSLKSYTYFWGKVMLVQDGFLYLIVTRHKLTVHYIEDLFMLVTHLNYNDVSLSFTVNIISYVICPTVPNLPLDFLVRWFCFCRFTSSDL